MENQVEEVITSPETVDDKKPAFLDKKAEEWTTDDAIEATKYAQTVYGQKEHWKKKANHKEETPIEKPKEEITKNNDGNDESNWREKMELKTDGYSEKEIEFIQQNGGKKSLENPIVKEAISNIREQDKANNAVITDDNKSDVEKKYSPEQLEGMPVEELEKLLPKAN